MLIIPTSVNPSQTFNVVLNNQNCTINLYQKTTGLYLDLLSNGSPVLYGVLCLNATLIVRDAYLGFIGDLAFLDLQGTDDPVYSGLGTRWVLVYLAPGDT